jgi:hypothetical protein
MTGRQERAAVVDLRPALSKLADRVEAYAARHGIPVDFAEQCLIEAGLAAEAQNLAALQETP